MKRRNGQNLDLPLCCGTRGQCLTVIRCMRDVEKPSPMARLNSKATSSACTRRNRVKPLDTGFGGIALLECQEVESRRHSCFRTKLSHVRTDRPDRIEKHCGNRPDSDYRINLARRKRRRRQRWGQRISSLTDPTHLLHLHLKVLPNLAHKRLHRFTHKLTMSFSLLKRRAKQMNHWHRIIACTGGIECPIGDTPDQHRGR